MSFVIAGSTSGIFGSDASCNILNVSNIINNSSNSVLFFNNFTSSTNYICVGQVTKTANNNTNYLSLTTNGDYGGGYCEFYLSGTHYNNAGFSIKYEFNITNGTTTNIITQGTSVITSGSAITGTTIGNFATVLPTITQTTSLRVTTFSVNATVQTSVGYVLFYRIISRYLSVANL